MLDILFLILSYARYLILLFSCIFQLQLSSAIDNMWLLAAERADEAGKEMAKVDSTYYA